MNDQVGDEPGPISFETIMRLNATRGDRRSASI
jgi:hypothetical protein